MIASFPLNPEDWVITQPTQINTSQIFLPNTITTTTIDISFIGTGLIFPIKEYLSQALKAKISRTEIEKILDELEVEHVLSE